MGTPRVGILMGSDSDWPKIKKVAVALDEFGVEFEVNVMSAHRTPHAVAEYATSAEERGIGVIIAAAGGAAHLAGVVAAHTVLPVIGIPVPTADLGGMDSLLATVQMPGEENGIPARRGPDPPQFLFSSLLSFHLGILSIPGACLGSCKFLLPAPNTHVQFYSRARGPRPVGNRHPKVQKIGALRAPEH